MAQSSDGVNFDGQPTTAPTATVEGVCTRNQALSNMLGALEIKVPPNSPNNSTTLNAKWQTRGIVRLTGRYVAPVVDNLNANAFKSAGNHKVTLIPIPTEAQ